MPSALGYFQYSDDDSISEMKDVLDLTQRTSGLTSPRRPMLKIPALLKNIVSPKNAPKCEEAIGSSEGNTPQRKTMPSRGKKQTKLVSVIPKQCATAWTETAEKEFKRFLKLTAEQQDRDAWFWDAKLQTDLPLANRLNVTGLVKETFDFSKYESAEMRNTVVKVFLKFLKASVKEVIGDTCTYLSEDGCAMLTKKVVAQGVVSLCQDFITEPYFRLLRTACESHGLKLLRFKDGKSGSDIIGSDGNVWRTEVNIHLSQEAMVVDVKKIFCTVWVSEMDMRPADYIFAFQRKYHIDILGGPAHILPPLWLGYSCGKLREIQSKPMRLKSSPIDHRHLKEYVEKSSSDNILSE